MVFRRDRVLLAQRGQEPLKGYWSLPGGVVELGETVREAVRRELIEETGLTVEPLEIVEVFERITRDAGGGPEYHFVIVDFLCRVKSGELAAADDVTGVAWMPLRDLGKIRLTTGAQGVIEKANEKRKRRSAGI